MGILERSHRSYQRPQRAVLRDQKYEVRFSWALTDCTRCARRYIFSGKSMCWKVLIAQCHLQCLIWRGIPFSDQPISWMSQFLISPWSPWVLCWKIPHWLKSTKKHIAIENGPSIGDLPVQMVIFRSYVSHYQSVSQWVLRWKLKNIGLPSGNLT